MWVLESLRSALPDPKFPHRDERIPFLTRETLVVFGATGAEASNKVALAVGKESVIEVFWGLKPSFWVLTPPGLHLLSPAGIGSLRFWGEIPLFSPCINP